ncbi:J domain-containing protein required for chloroplast accumulation response 1 isoform X2 [Oryza brachyantha]|uniref:J domain-containing protein n=1 Tax=Oryza brachyantha TaxID=4533 RepID=J3LL13_ORYBR|nr:J domain-containing protein required for chloroplast accumulation response 1 isoform X2 [Oryza brachyantha]
MAGAPPAAERPPRPDVDFADVFGGPPRRSSGHDSLRRSSMDSSFGSATRTRSGPEERPVFGERTSSDRRRQLGAEFYKDIFAGNESMSPRRGGAAGDLDVFGAQVSPGSTSRVRSSFSMKFNGGIDSSVPTSPSRHTPNRNDDGVSYAYSVPTSPNSSMNSFLAQGAHQQDSTKNPSSWHRYAFLSRFRSNSGDKDTSNYVSSMDSEREGTHVSLENSIDNNKFHFSFYKWGGKGAILVLPTNAQESAGDIVGARSFPQVIVQGIDLIDEEEDNTSTATGASKSQTDYEEYKSGKEYGLLSAHLKAKDGALPLVFDEYFQANKAEETGTKHSTDNTKNSVLGSSPSSKSSRSPSGEKSRGSRVKGKVKGFMKIFSPESSPKLKGTRQSLDRTYKNGSKSGVDDKFSLSNSAVDEDVRTANMSNRNVFPPAPSPISEVQDRAVIPVFTVDNEKQRRAENCFGTKEVTPPSSDELVDAQTKYMVGEGETTERSEGPVEDIEECVVEDVCEDLILRNNEEKEQIKISEYKIREWSKGKEGNIRSLLSTLQYVLWPESGWKPVPLVDIIEGAAVKKAYQKALLCLHPDKLQQRGVAMHQKYIAEKVFDILQEAWKEFNTVTFG